MLNFFYSSFTYIRAIVSTCYVVVRHHLSLQHRLGFSSLEFILTAIPALLLGMGAYELTRWYNTRHLLNLALVEAARTASVHHAKPEKIEKSFEEAITPLFATSHNPIQQREEYLQKVEQITSVPAWRITFLSPTHAHFMDFHRDDLEIAQQTGYYAIDNNYQKEQHQRKGIGLLSQENIYEANTLSLTLHYAYKPIVPGLSFLFKQLRHFYQDSHAHALLSHGFLPIQQELSISMQSHPVQWPSLTNGKIITSRHSNDVIFATRAESPIQEKCYGIWCQTTHNKSYNSATTSTPKPPSNQSTIPEFSHEDIKGYTPPTEHEATIDNNTSHFTKDHPLCGISLCCSPQE